MRQSLALPKTMNEMDMDTKSLSKQLKVTNPREILQFFQSEEFTPELLIHYFMATFNEPGPHQYLTQKLYGMPNMFVEYFIPQFCYMVIKISSMSMETFLEHLSTKSISNFFKIRWCISAYSEDERKVKLPAERIAHIERRFEKAMVNAAVKYSKEEILLGLQNPEFADAYNKQVQEKQPRAAYVGLVEKFLMNMIKLSLVLKQTLPEEQIKKGNRSIKKMRNSFPDLCYYWGITVPFERKTEGQEASNLIVRIIEDGFACFNTKTRVPYRILIETISPQEIQQKQNKFQGDASTDADQEDLLSREISVDFESQLREHTKAKFEDSCFKDLANFKSESPSLNNLDELDSPLKQVSPRQQFSVSPIKKRRQSWSEDKESNSLGATPLASNFGDLVVRHSRNLTVSMKQESPVSSSLLEEVQQLERLETNKQDERQLIKVTVHGPWGDDWDQKLAAIKLTSPFREFESYKIRTVMVKGGDDLRQELLAMQLIQKFDAIFKNARLNIYLKPYEIIVTSENSGILEFVPNTNSMDGLKKYLKKEKKTFGAFFKEYFGERFQDAQRNFAESLAGYSLLTYLLQIKDRHNGNILIDNQGHLVHIDFGFILSISPGNMGFENAPFKLTQDYIDVLEGTESRYFEYFANLMYSGFIEIQKNCASIFQIIEIMMEQSNFHCFKFFDIKAFKDRFKQRFTNLESRAYVNDLIKKSVRNWRTVKYDQFQQLTNGIEP